MSDRQTPREQAAEAAAIRRRWITLGEVLAVVAVTISGLTLWNSYSERSDAQADRAAASRKADVQAGVFALKASADADGRVLTLSPVRDDQVIQTQTISFPNALGTAPVETTGEARIEAGWFDDALKSARKAAKLDGKPAGDARLPLTITSRYLVNGDERTDVALYDVGYALDGRLLGGATVRLRGISLVERSSAGAAPGRLEALAAQRLR